jgi:hypothetical protein
MSFYNRLYNKTTHIIMHINILNKNIHKFKQFIYTQDTKEDIN